MRYPVGGKNKIKGKFETLNGGSFHDLRRPPEEFVNRPKYSGLRWSGQVPGTVETRSAYKTSRSNIQFCVLKD
jgi:hypothetical protein